MSVDMDIFKAENQMKSQPRMGRRGQKNQDQPQEGEYKLKPRLGHLYDIQIMSVPTFENNIVQQSTISIHCLKHI